LLIPDGWKAEIFYKLLSSVANWQISQICGNCLGIISRRIRHEDFTLPLAVFLLVDQLMSDVENGVLPTFMAHINKQQAY